MKYLCLAAFLLVQVSTVYLLGSEKGDNPTIFKTLNGVEIEVYPNWMEACRKDKEHIEYVYFINPASNKSCVLTYTYSKCKVSSCLYAEQKLVVTKNKTIELSTNDSKKCEEKMKRLTQKLKKLGFSCQGSGFN